MPVTEQQARAIAYLAVAARPHGAPRWDEAGVTANVMKVRDRSLASVVIAAMQAAEDRGATTPGVIASQGPHWRDPAAAPRPPTDPWNPHEFCELCGKRCDAHGGSDHEPRTAGEQMARRGDEDKITAAKDYARQALGDAKAAGITPPPERPVVRSEQVDQLRHLAEAGAADNEAAAAAESGA